MRSCGGAARCFLTLAMLAASGCAVDSRTLTVIPDAPAGVPLKHDVRGFISAADAGISGAWYAISDEGGANGCPESGFTREQCSMVSAPPFDGSPLDLPDPDEICAAGVAARLIPNPSTNELDYAHIWGAGMAFGFNARPGAAAMAYDARAHGITGMSFVIDTPPPPGSLNIEFLTTDAPAGAVWGGKAGSSSPVQVGLNVIRWADVGGPFYVMSPPAFDESKLARMQFHVTTNMDRAVPYRFCIRELTALRD